MKYFSVNYPPYGNFLIRGTNELTVWRAKTFAEKEPTTLEWLQTLTKDSFLIDVGANIGIYSIPASLFHVKKVISLEPEPLNFQELLANLKINNLNDERVTALPLAVSTRYAETFTKLYLSQETLGSSCHQLGENQDHNLKTLNVSRPTKSVYSISLLHLIDILSLPEDIPLHIKVDVDGIEADVCQSLFSSGMISRLSSIQVELNPNLRQHRILMEQFKQSNFTYSLEQVEKARRTEEGPFKGFAEYVFVPLSYPQLNSSSFSTSNLIKEQHQKLYSKYINI